MSDNIVFHGRIEEKDLKKLLFHATIKGAIGLLILPYSFILGALLIGWGFLPYNHLKTLSNCPPTLKLTSDTLTYSDGKKKILVPVEEINNIRFEKDQIFIDLNQKTVQLPPYFSFKTFRELKMLLESEEETESY